jgi:hypothetical protein
VCVLLAILAVVASLILSHLKDEWMSAYLTIFTIGLILFYDFAGKYLVAPGLITLGLIRFFHVTVAAPRWPVIWHPLLLLTHVAVLSTVAYDWEGKRPTLTKTHWLTVLGGVAGIDIGLATALSLIRHSHGATFQQALSLRIELVVPACAVVMFYALGQIIRRRSESPRQAGQTLMLAGLLWLIVYDAAFALEYVHALPALLLLTLLPVAWLSVQVMRWWSGVVALSQRPEFRRVET